ncbi:biliverdin-producing heme oxygenase [Shinella sp. S4-D37]|uniref:biliverdin-producing heme oxygenase n=1 Tax=Shinella sp. S4-D37 TaxID=3161999 RepID=UPI00346502EC
MNEVVTVEQPHDVSRAKRLKAATHAAHEGLDKAIMAGQPFSSRARYGLFLIVQHDFHRDIDALYAHAELDALLPDLDGRRRFGYVRQDLIDLGMEPPQAAGGPVFEKGEAVDIPTALGWLYVAEGSNLGAAFLLKEAFKLGLSETSGARHLAGAPEGRGLHWRTFTSALDTVDLSEAEEARVIAGAQAAFRRVQGLVDKVYGAAP